MRKNLVILFLMLAPLLILSVGCGKKAIIPESEFDSVDSHYDQGMRELEAGRLDRARWEFERGMGLDREDPRPYVGLALVETELGNKDGALEYIRDAVKKDDKHMPTFLARARIRAKFKDEHWYRDAMSDIKKAKNLEPGGGEVFFTEGMIHEDAFELDAAERAFSKVLELKTGFEEPANHELEKIHKIKRAAPGSKIGMKIGLVEKITRAETAVLFIEELKLIELLKKRERPEHDTGFEAPKDLREMEKPEVKERPDVPTDIESHWAHSYVEEIVNLGIRGMGMHPDHTFKPDEHLIRAEYALLVEDLLIRLLGDEELATKHIGEPSPFPDVGAAYYAFNAIRVCSDKGIMKADLLDNSFRPKDTVSGADALLIIKRLQDQLRTVF